MRGEDGPKSFYRKSMKSIRSIKSVKSDRHLRTDYTESSDSVPSSNASNMENGNLSKNYGNVKKQDQNTKFLSALID